MKLKFKLQPFQTTAVNAVVDLFCGQEKQNSTFTITQESQTNLIDNGYGVGNLLALTENQLVAIRESVHKSFETTKEHFALQYDNAPCRFFIYNSAKLSAVRNFAVSTDIEVMIINTNAFVHPHILTSVSPFVEVWYNIYVRGDLFARNQFI